MTTHVLSIRAGDVSLALSLAEAKRIVSENHMNAPQTNVRDMPLEQGMIGDQKIRAERMCHRFPPITVFWVLQYVL